MKKLFLPTIVLLLLAAAPAVLAQGDSVTVTMTYRERITLPPDARVDVSVLDTSRADAAAVVISAQRFAIASVPKTVRLLVDPAVIDDRHTYTVNARISSGNTVLFRTTSAFPVLTRDAGDEVEILLQQMPPSAATDTATAPHIVGVAWSVFEIAGRALVAADPPTLTIDDEGNFSLYAGCNRFTGEVRIDGDRLEFPPDFAGTRMACPGPRDKLERDVLQALSTVSGFTRNGRLLSLTNAAGITVMRLQERPE